MAKNMSSAQLDMSDSYLVKLEDAYNGRSEFWSA